MVRIDGEPLSTFDLAAWHRRVSLVPEHPAAYEASLRENIALGDRRTLLDDPTTVERIARESGLDAIASGLPQGIDTLLGRSFGTADLSRGQWQRVAIARALAGSPRIVLADEPTASLDPVNGRAVMDLLLRFAPEQGTTPVVASHDAELLSSGTGRLIQVEVDAQSDDTGTITSRVVNS
jgi:ATP-binding cassette subfamily B protein